MAVRNRPLSALHAVDGQERVSVKKPTPCFSVSGSSNAGLFLVSGPSK